MESVVLELSVIIISTAILCFIAEIAKQPLIVAYILAGIIVGPMGLNLIQSSEFFEALAQVGIVLLLYLIGLQLRPLKFVETLKKSYRVSVLSTLAITPIGLGIGWLTGLTGVETIYLTIAFLFSSTVVVIKTMRDERGVDEEVFESAIGILLVQDILAIFILLIINSISSDNGFHYLEAIKFFFFGILFIISAFLVQKYMLRNIIRKVLDRADLVFLIGLAWCFLLAEIAENIHLSRELGAFVAGLVLTNLPAHKLRVFVFKSETIRDFFMILFFFVLGANLRLTGLENYILTISLAIAFTLLIKPLIFYFSARHAKYTKEESKELGIRLGQNSEFSIIVAAAALTAGHITEEFSMVISIILFLSIITSNYVVKFFPIKRKKTEPIPVKKRK